MVVLALVSLLLPPPPPLLILLVLVGVVALGLGPASYKIGPAPA